MRGLLPPLPSVDASTWYAAADRAPLAGRAWVVVGMVTTIDGATAVGGVSGPIGGGGDRAVFAALRALADVILVGAGTARAERYRPPALPAAVQSARLEAGRAPLPRLAVVSRSLRFEPDTAFLKGGDPIVVTVAPDRDPDRDRRRQELALTATLLDAGHDEVDLADALGQLRSMGAETVLCEGGPTLNGALVAADLVDELCVTIAPTVASGRSSRLVSGPAVDRRRFLLEHVLEQDDELFLRYRRDRD